MSEIKIKFVTNSEYSAFLQRDILAAQEHVYLQTMSFEGDKVGKDLAEWLRQSKAKDKRLIVDSFSKVVINDRFTINPFNFLDFAFFKEMRDTKAILNKMSTDGIKVEYVNPLGLGLIYYPLRNHKKIVIADHVCYIGGINLCEHNFKWHDLMLRIEIPEITNCLISDFLDTWSGKNNNQKIVINNESHILFLDGRNSQSLYEELFQRLKCAQKTIKVYSPYITDPCLKVLKQISLSGIEVSIFTPEQNNKAIFNHYLPTYLFNTNIKIYRFTENMSHIKAILIDDRTLIFGSANFDCVSYYLEQEVILISKNQILAKAFKDKIAMVKYEELIILKATIKGRIAISIMYIVTLSCRILARVVKKKIHCR